MAVTPAVQDGEAYLVIHAEDIRLFDLIEFDLERTRGFIRSAFCDGEQVKLVMVRSDGRVVQKSMPKGDLVLRVVPTSCPEQLTAFFQKVVALFGGNDRLALTWMELKSDAFGGAAPLNQVAAMLPRLDTFVYLSAVPIGEGNDELNFFDRTGQSVHSVAGDPTPGLPDLTIEMRLARGLDWLEKNMGLRLVNSFTVGETIHCVLEPVPQKQ